MSDLQDALARAVLDAAGIPDDRRMLEADGHLALVAAAADAGRAAEAVLRRAVSAARTGGVSWARIGGALGMTRQAAQQRFGAASDDPPVPEQRVLGPVTAFDEMDELDRAGRAGWHTVGAGMFTHTVVRTPTQWLHRRILWRGVPARERADGWQVGCRAFPWIYLVKDTGLPRVDEGDAAPGDRLSHDAVRG